MPASSTSPQTNVAESRSYAAIVLHIFDASLFEAIVLKARDACIAQPDSATRTIREALQLAELFDRLRRAHQVDAFAKDDPNVARQLALFPPSTARDRPAERV